MSQAAILVFTTSVRPLVARTVRNAGWYLARGPWHWCMGSRQPGFQNQQQACFYDGSTQNTLMNHRTLKICCPCRRTEQCWDGSQMLIIKGNKRPCPLPLSVHVCECVGRYVCVCALAFFRGDFNPSVVTSPLWSSLCGVAICSVARSSTRHSLHSLSPYFCHLLFLSFYL